MCVQFAGLAGGFRCVDIIAYGWVFSLLLGSLVSGLAASLVLFLMNLLLGTAGE